MNFKETRNRHRRDISTLQVRVKRTHPQSVKGKTEKSQSGEAEVFFLLLLLLSSRLHILQRQ